MRIVSAMMIPKTGGTTPRGKDGTEMEIKKAFDTFKKELTKETGIKGGFTMNSRQIENRTATWMISRAESYEASIAEFETWAKSSDKFISEEGSRRVAYFKAEREQYGTKENYVATMIDRMTGSNAFKKFCETVGNVKFHKEISEYDGVMFVYLRFTY